MATSFVEKLITHELSNLMGGSGSGSGSLNENQIVKMIPEIEKGVIKRICDHIMANQKTLGNNIVELLEGRLKEILEPDAIENSGDINIKISEIVLDRFRKDFASINDAPLFLMTLSTDHKDKIIFIINDILTKNPEDIDEYFKNMFVKKQRGGGGKTKKTRRTKSKKMKTAKRRKTMKKMIGGAKSPRGSTVTHSATAPSTHSATALPTHLEPIKDHSIRKSISEVAHSEINHRVEQQLNAESLTRQSSKNSETEDQVTTYIDKMVGYLTFRLQHTGDEILKKIMANIDEAMKTKQRELTENIVNGISILIANSFASADPKKGANLIEIMIYSSLYKLRGTLQKCIDEIGRDTNNTQSESFASDVYEKLMSSIGIK